MKERVLRLPVNEQWYGLIKDEKISNKLRDSGSDISEVAVSDFLSMVTSSIIPSQIESKGDYLFAANMKYS